MPRPMSRGRPSTKKRKYALNFGSSVRVKICRESVSRHLIERRHGVFSVDKQATIVTPSVESSRTGKNKFKNAPTAEIWCTWLDGSIFNVFKVFEIQVKLYLLGSEEAP